MLQSIINLGCIKMDELNYYNSTKKNIYFFIVIPIVLNIILVGCYFSGISLLQHIVSPNDGFLTRESGLLEQLQNIYLLFILFIFTKNIIKREQKDEKIFFTLLSIVFLFLFLEEIDYGLNLYEFFLGHASGIELRNWHNQTVDGHRQNVSYFKQLIDIANIIWFVLIPLLAYKINFQIPILKSLMPNRFFIIGFILTALYSSITHSLDNMGLSIINGEGGSLTGNISEFREHNTYYLYLLYALQIINTKLTLRFKANI